MELTPVLHNYHEKGLTAETVQQSVIKVREKVQSATAPHADAALFSDIIYLNSSDPVKALYKSVARLSAQTVLTIAGSGEFAQAFVDKEPITMEIVDVSAPALFYNELKLAALRSLPKKEYMALLHSSERLFNPQMYPTVRHRLSDEARSYFDTLLKRENRVLMDPGVLCRKRPSSDGSFHTFLPSVKNDELSYRRFQERARRTVVSMVYSDVTDLPGLGEYYSLVYLSNIPELTLNYDLPKNFLRNGSSRVLFTMAGREKEGGKAEIVTDKETLKLQPGERFSIEGMHSRLLAYDRNVEFGALVEARRADNVWIRT